MARLDLPGRIKSLNVSNAAALALYVATSGCAGRELVVTRDQTHRRPGSCNGQESEAPANLRCRGFFMSRIAGGLGGTRHWI